MGAAASSRPARPRSSASSESGFSSFRSGPSTTSGSASSSARPPKGMAVREGRSHDELRLLEIVPDYVEQAHGSALIAFGRTRVLCAATIEEGVPRWLAGSGQGWLTAEYGMLPASTSTRTAREASAGKQKGRTVEIQRLIGRSLRAAYPMDVLGERTVWLDCDVLQADG